MKKYIPLFIFILYSVATFSQAGKKPFAKEKPPTQKEMEAMMKESEKMMAEISAEDKKMMDSMGIKMPDTKTMKKNVAGVSDAQLKQAYEDEMRIVPLRDAARIASIAAAPLTTASLPSFVSSAHNKVVTQIEPQEKNTAEELYQMLTGQQRAETGNIAAGLWMTGRPQLALCLLGKACIDNTADDNNINNYAAMLSMGGAEQLSVPLLNYINKKFPGNSTILNNLGQAWFGLGEITKAEKYLDSAIRIYANHPQANHTKSFIEEAKGHKTEAVALEKKALQHSYAQEKEDRLRKLGDKMNVGDVNLPPKTKADPLNLGAFMHPPFPKSVDECILLQPEWEAYRDELDAEGAKLKKMAKDALEHAQQMQQQRANRDIAMIRASLQAGSPQGVLTSVPMHIKKGSLKLKEVTDDYGRKMEEWGKKGFAFLTGRGLQLRQEYDKEMEKLREEDGEQTGEGRPNKDFCPKYKAASDKFLKAFNTETEDLFIQRLAIVKPFLNDMAYYSMYTNWPEMFEVIKLEAKTSWLGTLRAEAPANFESITDFVCKKEEVEKKEGKLAEFDDVACKYHSEMSLVAFKIKTDCSRMTTELDAKFIKLKLKQNMDKETFGEQFMNCTVTVKAEAGIGKVKLGPLEAGAKAEAGVEVEIDRTGVTDVSIIAGVKAGIGIKNDEGKVKIGGAGAEAKMSLISGKISGKGTGMLKMIK